MRRIALISGGSSGIGEACVRLFAKDGWAVVFLCRTHPERAQAITDELRGKGLDVAFRTCDIADSEQVNDTVAAILKDYKHIDALVNCAGIAYRGLLTDFINMSGHNPLTGKNLAEFGTRFPDMTHAYDVQLMEKCRQAAKALGIPLQEGVYMWMNGPTYETPAEIRMARILGADAVGMSTVPETIVARHCGIRVLGVSCITNMAAGIIDQPLDEQEVIETAARVKGTFRALLDETIRRIGEE